MKAFGNISYLMLEVNSSCNLSCLSCNRERLKKEGRREEKKMTKEEFAFILEKFKDCPIDTVKLEGLSEPMFHPEFDQRALELRKAFPSAFVIIATNLQYDFRSSPFLRTLPYVDMVYLSLDATEELYEGLRLGASWKKAQAWLEACRDLVSKEERQRKLYINVTLSEKNIAELPRLYKLSEDYGLAGLRLNLAQNWSEDEPNTHVFSPRFLKALLPYKKDLKGSPCWDYRDCFWPYAGIVVDVFGDVRQCVINTNQKALGNIFRDNVEKLFNESVFYQESRRKLDQGEVPHSCRYCDYKFLAPLLSQVLDKGQNPPRSFKR